MKKIIALLCLVLTMLSVFVIPTFATVEYMTLKESFFTGAFYVINNRAFLIPQEKILEALTEEGAIIELPEETANQPITIYCLLTQPASNGPYNGPYELNSTTTVDGDAAITSARINSPSPINHYFYFVSSESATYDEKMEIGTSEKLFLYWCYEIDRNGVLIFLDKFETEELTRNKTLYLTNDQLIQSQKIDCDYLSTGPAGLSYSAEVQKNLMITFTLSKASEEYKIYVNYKESFSEKLNRFVNYFLGFLEILMDFFIKLEF